MRKRKARPQRRRIQSETALWAAYTADHDNQALRNRLVERYIPLADAAANRLIARLPNCCDADSIRQEVRMALLRLVERFIPGRRVGFATYAHNALANRGRDYLRAVDHISRMDRATQAVYEAGVAELTQRLGRCPTQQEIDDEGLSAPAIAGVVSLSTAGSNPGRDTLTLEDEISVDCRKTRRHPALPPHETFAAMLRGLDENSRTAAYLYYAKGRRQHEIATMLDLSETRVSQLLASARRRLAKRGIEKLL